MGHEDEWGQKLNLKVYWIIDDTKAAIDDPDLIIKADSTKVDSNDNPDLLPDYVAGHYDNGTGGIDAAGTILTPSTTAFVANSGVATATELKYHPAANGLAENDLYQMSYRGGPFIIDGPDVPKALELINAYKKADGTLVWGDVEKHIVNVEFSAPVYKELFGTPPRIALMNDEETITTSGNAKKILEPYLRMAGVCADNYDILAPYGDIAAGNY